MVQGLVGIVLCTAILAMASEGSSAEPGPFDRNSIIKLVTTTSPKVRAEKVDQENLTVRRIDVVDSKGVIRMTIAGELPGSVIDGVEYKKSQPVGGILLRDEKGNERGGFAYGSTYQLPLLALDYPTGEAIGFNVLKDGSANFMILSRPPDITDATLGPARLPGGPQYTGIRLSMSKDGVPGVNVNDRHDRPRLRLTVTQEGYGAIEFLDAGGQVVQTIAPERDLKR